MNFAGKGWLSSMFIYGERFNNAPINMNCEKQNDIQLIKRRVRYKTLGI